MKIGVLLVSHSQLAQGMKIAAEFVVGKQENFEAVGLDDLGIERFKNRLNTKVDKMSKDIEGLVIVSDIPSGSPGANAMLLAESYDINIKVISGMNLALVIDIVLSRESKELNSLVKGAITNGTDSIGLVTFEEEIDEGNDCF